LEEQFLFSATQLDFYGSYSQIEDPLEKTAKMSTEIDTKAGSLIDNNEIGNENKMFVGGLSKKTTVEAFRTYFEAYGEVKDVVVKTDPSTGTSRGFGFVMFTAEESIGKVLAAGPHNLDGKRIDPKKAERRDGKMFVGGVKSDTTVETIKEYFSQFGEVESVDRPVNKQTNENKPFCFVIFKKDGVNSKCIKQRYHEIDGKRCECKEGIAKERMAPVGQFYGGAPAGMSYGYQQPYGSYMIPPQQWGQGYTGYGQQWGGPPQQMGPRGGGRGAGRGGAGGRGRGRPAPY